MDGTMVVTGVVGAAAAVLSLWTYAAVLFSERQYLWGSVSTLAGSFVLFLALAGVDAADDWWDE